MDTSEYPAQGMELERLREDALRLRNWKRWGPYLAERQWGTVREDYSADGDVWTYLPHEQARSRAYRWGEDGLLGMCDREGRLCFALALWNGRDPILKERLFGLTGPQGNHGEDVKECYFYLDSTPTHSYMRALYKYPQQEFPYDALLAENQRRSREDPEFELTDTGVFADNRYFDIFAEYAKAHENDILIRVTVANRGPDAATLHVLPTLWFRNTWSWGRTGDEYFRRPSIHRRDACTVHASHSTLGDFVLVAGTGPDGQAPELLFTGNETNFERLFGVPNAEPFVKDAFHDYVIGGVRGAVNAEGRGTKAAMHYVLTLRAGESRSLRLRLVEDRVPLHEPLGTDFEATFELRQRESDAFYDSRVPSRTTDEERNVLRQGFGGLFWSKQFYHYVVSEWLDGDPASPPPPASHRTGRNSDWRMLHCRDVLSMPDKWEYPWFAAWDLAFHTVALGGVDGQFARDQLLLLLREWYTHPSGQLPAYEFAFGDVNPPVHAWACWRVYKMSGMRGRRDVLFLKRAFQKLLINFTWWVNRKDEEGNNLFGGGFLGLDNIGVFDRSKPLPTGGHLEQADGTAWMAFYCLTMLSMALELSTHDASYEDVASKFFEHFVAICDAMNSRGETGLWDDVDGFYYDEVHANDAHIPLRVRSMVGLVPLFAVEVIEQEHINHLPGFRRRLDWFLRNRPDLAQRISLATADQAHEDGHKLLAVPTRDQLTRVLRYVLDEREFLSPHGIRSLSRIHAEQPYVFRTSGAEYSVEYVPGESKTGLFGGNSNWRGPIWFPLNYLLVEALERYHHFYGDTLTVEYPTGSGTQVTLDVVAFDLTRRLTSIFLPDEKGARPVHGTDGAYATDPYWRDLVLFYEYFHGESGRGVGASHQTGWTALAVRFLEDAAKRR